MMFQKNLLGLRRGPVAFLGSIATHVATPRLILDFCLVYLLTHIVGQIDNTIELMVAKRFLKYSWTHNKNILLTMCENIYFTKKNVLYSHLTETTWKKILKIHASN